MKKNRYINATNLCNNYNKKLDKWTRNDNSKALIEIVDDKLNTNRITPLLELSINDMNNTSLIQVTNKNYNGILRGAYTTYCKLESW